MWTEESVEYGFIDFQADSVAPRSDCADVWADLELHYLQTTIVSFGAFRDKIE